MANRISFVVESFQGESLAVTPCVDGALLSEMVTAFEAVQGFTPVGGYGGLVPAHHRFGPLDRHFLGQGDERYLLGCQCGEVGCWPLNGEVTSGDGEVTWSRFRQPHRPGRDYAAFGPFRFDRAQYNEALRDLVRRVET